MNRAERRRQRKLAAKEVAKSTRGRTAGRAEALYALGNALDDEGRPDEAAARFRDAIALRPDHAEAHNNLGIILRKLGRHEDAMASYRAALAARPDYARAHNNLGNVLLDLGRAEEAIASYQAAIAVDPLYARAHYNLGNALDDSERWDAAAISYGAALALVPNDPEAHNNLAVVLRKLGRPEESAAHCRAALALAPHHAEAHNTLGLALVDLDRPDEAAASYRAALAIAPDYAEAYNNLGLALDAAGNPNEAVACCRQALAIRPNFEKATQTLASLLLGTGHLDEGWALYDAVLGMPLGRLPARAFRAPPWRGEPVTDRRILVWREQGVGDEIRFAGAYADLIARCGSCVIEATPRLRSILARSFPEAEVRDGLGDAEDHNVGGRDDENFDVQIPAGSLARHLRPTVEAFPRHHGYLRPDPERVAHWRHRIEALGVSRVIGISWTSGLVTPARRRSYFYTALDDWRPLFALSDCALITLQYGDHEEEIRAAEATHGVRLHRWPDLDPGNDLESMFALVSSLDAVVSARNITVDIAGSLGVPAITSLQRGDDQGLGTGGIPWYPSVSVVFRDHGEPHAARLKRMAAVVAGVPPRRPGTR